MHRAIATAAFVIAIATVVLLRAHLPGLFVEPALLAVVGAFFLLAARITAAEEKAQGAPVLRESASR